MQLTLTSTPCKRATYILLMLLGVLNNAVIVAQKSINFTPRQDKVERHPAFCSPSIAQTDLDINNVRTTILTGGDMWWDNVNPKYEVPKGSGLHSIFAGAIWLGGVDPGGNIRVAAQTYRQYGYDFWAGPLDTTITDISVARCLHYDRHWKITKQEVQDFISFGTTTPDIVDWPAHGDPAFNESYYLAPFVDVNADGVYNITSGDYPGYNLSNSYPNYPGTNTPVCNDGLFGDQTVWWVLNDMGNIHTATGSSQFGVEIRCQAFAISNGTTHIDNTTFYKYQMINRSSNTYTNMHFGQWVDPDLGNPNDDAVACDVTRGLGYCYNGDPDDNGIGGYGLNPPAIGVKILKGPNSDIGDAIDNDYDGCVDCTFLDSSGFTIAVSDYLYPEPIKMSSFISYENTNGVFNGNPSTFTDFYDYLSGKWIGGSPITHYNASGPITSYVNPYNTHPFITQPTYPAWPDSLNIPNGTNDRRFIMGSGQFTFMPGAVQFITTSVIWARQSGGGQLGSVPLLWSQSDSIQLMFDNCFRLLSTSTEEVLSSSDIMMYHDHLTQQIVVDIHDKSLSGSYKIELFEICGKKVLEQLISDDRRFISTASYTTGIYLVRISNELAVLKSIKLYLQ